MGYRSPLKSTRQSVALVTCDYRRLGLRLDFLLPSFIARNPKNAGMATQEFIQRLREQDIPSPQEYIAIIGDHEDPRLKQRLITPQYGRVSPKVRGINARAEMRRAELDVPLTNIIAAYLIGTAGDYQRPITTIVGFGSEFPFKASLKSLEQRYDLQELYIG